MYESILACPIQPLVHISNSWERFNEYIGPNKWLEKKLEWSEMIISSPAFDLKIRGISTKTKQFKFIGGGEVWNKSCWKLSVS